MISIPGRTPGLILIFGQISEPETNTGAESKAGIIKQLICRVIIAILELNSRLQQISISDQERTDDLGIDSELIIVSGSAYYQRVHVTLYRAKMPAIPISAACRGNHTGNQVALDIENR